jgi:hypothetical protein
MTINNQASKIWSALRDFNAVDRRVAPGFVMDSKPDGDARIVTFANGTSAREQLIDLDDKTQRLVYAIASERVKHYSAAIQVFDESGRCCRVVWIVDLLPNEIASYVGAQMDDAVRVMKPTLERA